MPTTDAGTAAIMKRLDRIDARLDGLDRVEGKIDQLLGALADEEEPEPQRTLEGEDAGRERDQSRSLDEG